MKTILLFVLFCILASLIIVTTDAVFKHIFTKNNRYIVYLAKPKCADLLMNENSQYLPVLKKEVQSQYAIHSITKNVSEHIAFDTVETECGMKKETQIFINDGRYYNVFFQSEKDFMRFMKEVLRK